jgi:hypothetical protein
MKTSEVFRQVHDHLLDEGYMYTHERYICYAIEFLYYKAKTIGDRDRTRCKKIIYNLLGDSGSLEAWLYDNHKIQNTLTPRYIKKVMVTRKAWLTHLINHYQSKGD